MYDEVYVSIQYNERNDTFVYIVNKYNESFHYYTGAHLKKVGRILKTIWPISHSIPMPWYSTLCMYVVGMIWEDIATVWWKLLYTLSLERLQNVLQINFI